MGGMDHPVIADFKLGTQSWEPGATPEKIAKMVERDNDSTTPLLGFRVVSAMLPQGDAPPAAGYLPSGRVAVKQVLEYGNWRAGRTRSDVSKILRSFFHTSALRETFKEKL